MFNDVDLLRPPPHQFQNGTIKPQQRKNIQMVPFESFPKQNPVVSKLHLYLVLHVAVLGLDEEHVFIEPYGHKQQLAVDFFVALEYQFAFQGVCSAQFVQFGVELGAFLFEVLQRTVCAINFIEVVELRLLSMYLRNLRHFLGIVPFIFISIGRSQADLLYFLEKYAVGPLNLSVALLLEHVLLLFVEPNQTVIIVLAVELLLEHLFILLCQSLALPVAVWRGVGSFVEGLDEVGVWVVIFPQHRR